MRLFNKDVEGAKNELILAAEIKGSPQLNTFGPNMTLAKELLEIGEKEIVLKYFDECLKFWNSDNAKEKIREWKKTISSGDIPNFEGNLVY